MKKLILTAAIAAVLLSPTTASSELAKWRCTAGPLTDRINADPCWTEEEKIERISLVNNYCYHWVNPQVNTYEQIENELNDKSEKRLLAALTLAVPVEKYEKARKENKLGKLSSLKHEITLRGYMEMMKCTDTKQKYDEFLASCVNESAEIEKDIKNDTVNIYIKLQQDKSTDYKKISRGFVKKTFSDGTKSIEFYVEHYDKFGNTTMSEKRQDIIKYSEKEMKWNCDDSTEPKTSKKDSKQSNDHSGD